MNRNNRRAVATAAILLLCGILVTAQEKSKPAPPKMDQQAAMEMMQKLATPGAGHKKLDVLIGSWTTKNSMWMEPDKAPEVTEGTSEHRWTLGGRFLEQRYEGKFMGMPFSGIGYTGYDNYKKKYVSVWMDSFGTSMMNMTGSFDKSGKVLTSTGRIDDFTTGKVATVRETMTLVGNDEVLFEMWSPSPEGKEYKMMEIRYTRKK